MQSKSVYLLLFAAGVVLPMAVFVPWILAHGLDIPLMVKQLFANRVSTFFAVDLLLTAVCVIQMARADRFRVPLWWLPVCVTCLVGVSAGLPLLLYLRALRKPAGPV